MIRRANEKDIPKIGDLLSQVCLVHHNGRPDIFGVGRKYSDEELKVLLKDANRPILVSVDDNDEVMGYCFGILEQHIGKELYEAAVALARESGCYNLTLNVWSCNPSAIRFYEAQGLLPQKIGMELIL